MTWLSIALIGIGIADLVRARGAGAPARSVRLVPAVVVGCATIVGLVLLADVTDAGDVLAAVVMCAGLAAWVVTSERTQRTGRGAGVPLGVLAGLFALLVGLSGWSSDARGLLGRWIRWADLPELAVPLTTDRVLLLLALVLLNVATANIIVRLVLLAIGALRPDQVVAAARPSTDPEPADRLKGGRLLGPMERLLILGLGLAGEFGAAGLVIAAKGLLRFPEIQAASRALPATPAAAPAPPAGGAGATTSAQRPGPVGIDDVTEYFLIGSFVSWLVALGSLALVALG